eukprot:COSAG01_NODE_1195_length_11304_cov_118.555823_16_plen_86_part_00
MATLYSDGEAASIFVRRETHREISGDKKVAAFRKCTLEWLPICDAQIWTAWGWPGWPAVAIIAATHRSWLADAPAPAVQRSWTGS